MSGSDLDQRLNKFNQGFYDTWENRLPGADNDPDVRFGRNAAGRHASVASAPTPKDRGIWDGIVGLFGLAGGVIGFFVGANYFDQGWIALPIVAGTTIAGFVIAIAPPLFLQFLFSSVRERWLWSRQRHTSTADKLVQFWTAKFGAPPTPQMLEAVANGGAGWVMDAKGNFILRMTGGSKMFVGHDPSDGALTVRKHRGGRFEAEHARHIALLQRSLGHSSIRMSSGTKQHKRMLWAAAKLEGLEVDDYQPDAKALRLLDAMRNDLDNSPVR